MRPLRGMYIIAYVVEHLTERSEPAERETDAAVEKPQLTHSALQRPSRRWMYQTIISMW